MASDKLRAPWTIEFTVTFENSTLFRFLHNFIMQQSLRLQLLFLFLKLLGPRSRLFLGDFASRRWKRSRRDCLLVRIGGDFELADQEPEKVQSSALRLKELVELIAPFNQVVPLVDDLVGQVLEQDFSTPLEYLDRDPKLVIKRLLTMALI